MENDLKVPPYIFDTDDDVLNTLSRCWDVCDPAVSIAWITRGVWKTNHPDCHDLWWQDGDTMNTKDFWLLVDYLRDGNWA